MIQQGRPGTLAGAALIQDWIEALGAEIAAGDENRTLSLVGVPRRGSPLAERLAVVIRAHGRACTITHADPTLWRDDFDASAHHVTFAESLTPSEVEGRHLIIVDDVLMTGRTIRAVLDHVMLLGRPSRVQLAVLVDRGGREVPIQPDFAAARIDVPRDWQVEFRISEIDGDDAMLIRGSDTAGTNPPEDR